MFDIGAVELLVIVVVAILVIGPKDMPLAMRAAGRWIGKIRRVSAQFRSGMDAMIREAELEDMEAKWKKQNEDIMARTSASGEMTGPPIIDPALMDGSAESATASDVEAAALACYDAQPAVEAEPDTSAEEPSSDEPHLPFDHPSHRA